MIGAALVQLHMTLLSEKCTFNDQVQVQQVVPRLRTAEQNDMFGALTGIGECYPSDMLPMP